jgi:predicted RNA methylase
MYDNAPAPTAELAALLARCAPAGYTPAQRELPLLLEIIATASDGKARKTATRALLRAGEAALAATLGALDAADAPSRPHLARALAAFATAPGAARDRLEALLQDPDPRVARAAIQAIGAWDGLDPGSATRFETTLLALWPSAPPPSRRALLRTLGRLGAAPALALVDAVRAAPDTALDPELARLADEAHRLLTRRATRPRARVAARIAAPLRAPVPVRLRTKPGLEALAAEALSARLPELAGRLGLSRGAVNLTWNGHLAALLQIRLFIDAVLPLPPEPLAGGPAPLAVARAVARPAALALLETLAPAPIRYRIGWDGPNARAATRDAVRHLERLAPALINDPSARAVDLEARLTTSGVEILILPRAPDRRFDWRVADVPAASHPTLAAALVQLGGVHPRDIVWDPFCGSGLELIERAVAGPFQRLLGSDVDVRALDAASANLARADVRAELVRADAATAAPGPVDLIVTNPPLGSRVGDGPHVRALMEAFVANVARVLRPGGRMAWLTRQPRHTDPLLAAAGLAVTRSFEVDLGGVRVAMQRVEWARGAGRP